MHMPSIPEIEVLVVQVAVFILLIFGLGELLIMTYYRFKRRLIEERRKTAQLVPAALDASERVITIKG